MARLAGSRVLVLNWRDVRHTLAGGAETYAHEISRRWVAAGISVTWLTAREAGQSRTEVIDGVRILRAGSTFSVYARTALRLLRGGSRFDAVVDCQNGIPFFAPLFLKGETPVVQVVHHVHQDQFATRFSPAGAAVGRFLEGRVAGRVYTGHRTVAVSASTRQELRRRLGVGGVVDVVPNGCSEPPEASSQRAEDPTIVVTSRLVRHKRIDLLLHAVSAALPDVPRLRVEIIGDGPELTILRRMSVELGLGEVVRFLGRLADSERDTRVGRAWLTTSTSEGEGWGCVVLEAAAAGVPCLALRVPGIRDSVVDGSTGWLFDDVDDLAAALPRVVAELGDRGRAAEMATRCQAWARCFTWERAAELLAGSVVSEMRASSRSRPRGLGPRRPTRRHARSDITTLARFRHEASHEVAASLRLTDEVANRGDELIALLRGCDEVDAVAVLARLGARDTQVRLATRHEVLAGPAGAAPDLAAEDAPVVPGVAIADGP